MDYGNSKDHPDSEPAAVCERRKNLEPGKVTQNKPAIVTPFQDHTASDPYFLPDDSTPDYAEHVAELCQGLCASRCHRWLLAIRDRKSLSEIAKVQHVPESAIITCFRSMARINPYVQIYLRHLETIRQAQSTSTNVPDHAKAQHTVDNPGPLIEPHKRRIQLARRITSKKRGR